MSQMAVAAGVRALGHKQSESGQPGRAAAPPASPGPQHPMLHLQQSLGNQAVLGLLGSGSREASGGRPLPSAVRGLMEERFQADFGGVRVHTDSRAAMLSRALQAKAFTRGSDIFFSAGRYSPGSPGGERLLAHELAHVVQQGGRAGGTARLGDPGSAAERGAEQAAEAVMAGAPVPRPGVAPAGEVQRAPDPVYTNGGTWKPHKYDAVNFWVGVHKMVGADMTLLFAANELVEADTIGLIQSVKALKSTKPGGPIDTAAAPSPLIAGIQLTSAQSDPGRSIDKLEENDPGSVPSTNPLVPVMNGTGTISYTLTDVAPDDYWGSHGHRIRRPPAVTGGPPTWDQMPAVLKDRPHAPIEFPGQQWRMSFEVTALVVDGPMANTYLGSVAWGWSSDASGNATLDPDPIRIVRAGAPSSQLMDAAQKWNNATFNDSTGKRYDTVDLPLTTLDSGSVRARDRPTGAVVARLASVEGELRALPAGVDRTNKEFEKRVLEAELRLRDARVSVHVISTQDYTGADQVYVRMSGPGGSSTTGVRNRNNGESADFYLPLSPLMPITGPITVEVWDQDSPDPDDLIVTIPWVSPYGRTYNTTSMSGANYQVAVEFKN